MNREKWQAKGVPLQTLALKLSEEAAEVGNVLTDTMIVEEGSYQGERNLTKRERSALMEELDQVQFLVRVIRQRLR